MTPALLSEFRLDGLLQLVGLESAGALRAAISDLAILRNEVEPIGLRTVGPVGGVFHVIHDGGQRQIQVLDRCETDFIALLESDGIFDRLEAARRAGIDGVCFLDVNQEELNLSLEFVVEFGKPTGFTAERWSCIAAED